MAGELEGFDPDGFRADIAATMTMGLPQSVAERPTFYFPTTSATYPPGTLTDSEGRAIDPRIKPTSRTAKDALQVPCAVEFASDTTNDTGLAGTQWDGRAVVTLLDLDYEKVKDAIEVNLAGRRYLIQEMTEVGLGTVTVYSLLCFRKGVETA